jgi:hypothetical protein
MAVLSRPRSQRHDLTLQLCQHLELLLLIRHLALQVWQCAAVCSCHLLLQTGHVKALLYSSHLNGFQSECCTNRQPSSTLGAIQGKQRSDPGFTPARHIRSQKLS